MAQSSRYVVDDDDEIYGSGGSFRIPDKDVYRRMITTFGTVHNYFHSRVYVRCARDRIFSQPHFAAWKEITAPFASTYNPGDGVCTHFLRRGLIKPHKTQMTSAVWSTDARWLILGTVTGDLALWEGDSLKIYKPIGIAAHKVFSGKEVVDVVPITALAWSSQRDLLVSGDRDGLIHYCDETFRFVQKVPDAHNGPIRGLSFSPLDSKLVSCSDDGKLHIWTPGDSATPVQTLTGHQNDVKCVDWHPYRSLICSGSRDSAVKLWDPKSGTNVCTLQGHKKQVNCCKWNQNGNWLATGSKDGLIKLFDIRSMREIEVYKGHNSDVCSIAWHPYHESLLLSGGYNGSLIYWQAKYNQAPHTIISDAHRQSVDVIAWHPGGHAVATSSHEGILKFWSREPPGSTLEVEAKEFQDNPVVAHGPLPVGAPNIVQQVATSMPGSSTNFASAPSSSTGQQQGMVGNSTNGTGGPGREMRPRGDRMGGGGGRHYGGGGGGRGGGRGRFGTDHTEPGAGGGDRKRSRFE